ncbi:GntR family transcriptional regulator [Atopobium sp. oral taxon 416]|uniref:GntR family transcriptional regulator n=1 Tax=Atopobium sp. oral taxon 416 TaxID=712157 RepID=UPI001BA88550|nr:GntR family transcriptional regulator [Atopobium sp. oral taxon 416]QUC03465.1 GntR family transcriptional regulator [Atopobium sp. oral taxon 416]
MDTQNITPSDMAYENILAYLAQHHLKEGDKLPAERDLCGAWGISRTALRAALKNLISLHVLESRGGSGTYVAMRRPQSNCRGYNGFSDTVRAADKVPSSQVIYAREEVADEHVARKLKLKVADPIFELRRLRKIDNKPCMIETVYLNTAVCPGISEYDFTDVSLVDTLREHYHVDLPHGEVKLSITRADAQEATYLQIVEGTPVYFQTGVSKQEDLRCVEYFKAVIRPDMYSFYARQSGLARGKRIPERVIGNG